jgi:hypothetical protein
MIFHLLVILTAVVAGYYASEAYMTRWSWKHLNARLYSILIFIGVMYLTQEILYRAF